MVWYDDGQKEEEYTFKDGEKDGLYTNWWDDGQKQSELTFKDGELISLKYWDGNGNLTETSY